MKPFNISRKKVETKQTEEHPVNIKPVPLPTSQNKGGTLPEDNEGGAEEDDANEPPIVQPNLRRSTKSRVESHIYPLDEYVTY